MVSNVKISIPIFKLSGYKYNFIYLLNEDDEKMSYFIVELFGSIYIHLR